MQTTKFNPSTSKIGFGLTVFLALPFAIFGCVMFYNAIHTITSSIEMESWPTVPAIIRTANLEHSSKSSNAAKATYTYTVNDRQFSGDRVSLYGGDNLGSFQKDVFDQLLAALSTGSPFPVHVNPQNPEDSILVPTLRWEVIGFNLLFALVFGGAGWGMLIASYFRYKKINGERQLINLYPNEPWRQRVEWRTNKINSMGSSTAVAMVCLALMWNLLTSPVLIAVVEKVKAGEYAILFALIFPLVGLGLIYLAAIAVARAKRFGRTYLELDTYPARQGERLRGKIFAPDAFETLNQVNLKFSCERKHKTSRSQGGSEIKTQTIWKLESNPKIVRGQSSLGDIFFVVDFPVPAELPDSSNGSTEWHTWMLESKAALTGADFEAKFEVPVFKR